MQAPLVSREVVKGGRNLKGGTKEEAQPQPCDGIGPASARLSLSFLLPPENPGHYVTYTTDNRISHEMVAIS
jgi:hypothetical protein